jgi:hypothetical protein
LGFGKRSSEFATRSSGGEQTPEHEYQGKVAITNGHIHHRYRQSPEELVHESSSDWRGEATKLVEFTNDRQ